MRRIFALVILFMIVHANASAIWSIIDFDPKAKGGANAVELLCEKCDL